VTRGPDFSTRARRPPVGAATAAFIATGVLVLGLAAHAAWAARQSLGRARESLESARRETEDLRARTRGFDARGLRGREVLGAQAWLTSEAPPPRLLQELGALLPPDVRFEGMTLRYGRRLDLELRVVAREARSYDLFLKRLAASPRIEDLTPGAENRDGEVRSTVRASYRPEDRP
jgi:hypothetical protein